MDKSLNYLSTVIPDWNPEKKQFNAPLNASTLEKSLGSITTEISKISSINLSKDNGHLKELTDKVLKLDILIRHYGYIENAARESPQEIIDALKEREFTEYKSCLQRLGIENTTEERDCEKQITNMVAVVKDYLCNNIDVNSKDESDSTEILLACKAGDLEKVNLLISLGSDVNIGSSNHTPIDMASIHGFKDIVALLINNNANLNVDKVTRTDPLHSAISHGKAECAKLLIEAGCADKSIETYLATACENGLKDIVSVLIEKMVKNRLPFSYIPLETALLSGNEECANLLIEAGCNIGSRFGTPTLIIACMNGLKEVVALLIEKKVDLNILHEGNTPLHSALSYGREECAKLLIEAGANVNSIDRVGRTALHIACKNGFNEVVALLITKNAYLNVKHDFSTPLLTAISNGREECAKLLIKAGADIEVMDGYSRTPLHIACEKGFKDVVALLIQKKVNLNGSFFRNVPLHIALSYGREDCAVLIIEAGASTSISDEHGRKVIHIACEKGFKDVVALLIKMKVNLNILQDGSTPLHTALSYGKEGCAKLLIEAGVDVNIADKHGKRPLRIACEKGLKEMIALIISKNVDLNDFCFGSTPLHITLSNDREDCAKLLIEAGADIDIKDCLGKTAIRIAYDRGLGDALSLLVEKNEINDLFKVANANEINKLKEFVEKKTNLFAFDRNGNSPISILIKKNHELLLPTLKTLDIDFKKAKPNKNGDSLLHIAAKVGNPKMVEYLLEKGFPASDEIFGIIKPLILDPSLYGEQCTLCMDEYEVIAERGVLVKAACGHMFDKPALAGWIERNIKQCETPECPTCQAPLSDKDLVVRVALKKQIPSLQNPLDHLVTLNCHGTFSSESFELPSNVYIMAPHPKGFDEPYTLNSPDYNQSFEELIAKQQDDDFIFPSSGGWRVYIPGQSVSNLKLSPWNENRYEEWSDKNPEDALLIDKTGGIPPFASAPGRSSTRTVVQYGSKDAQKVVVFSNKNAQGEMLSLKDIVLDLVAKTQDSNKPILLIPFCCNAKGDGDISISCTSYGNAKLQSIVDDGIKLAEIL